MAKKKESLADYEGLASLAIARQGKETTPVENQPAPKAQGKRGAGEIQVSAFLDKGLYKRVKLALVEDDLTFRDLLARLLEEWLRNR